MDHYPILTFHLYIRNMIWLFRGFFNFV